MKCPECGGPIKGGVCQNCGYKVSGDEGASKEATRKPPPPSKKRKRSGRS